MHAAKFGLRITALTFSVFLCLVSAARGEDRLILGKKVAVKKHPTTHRVVIKVIADEKPTDVRAEPVGYVTIVANADAGGSTSHQTFSIPGGWDPVPGGWRLRGSNGAVRRGTSRRNGERTRLKLTIRGFAPEAGRSPVVKVFPPNPGKGMGLIIFQNPWRDRYCVEWGDLAGGMIGRNDSVRFSVRKATSKPGCPTVPSVCGDGVIEGEEECEDGNTVDGDCCSSSCQFDEGGAACDDGDFCTAVDECDWAGHCVGTGSRCGDGNVDGECGEECDETGESESCDADCTTPICGDLTVNVTAGEECDDGNQEDLDGCFGQCLCNVATTPDACNLTGQWTYVDLFGYELALRFSEDTAGNSVYSGTWGPSISVAGEAARSDSCGAGTVRLTYPARTDTYDVRYTVHDSCKAVTGIVEDPEFIPFTLERVGSPSAAFLDVTSGVLD